MTEEYPTYDIHVVPRWCVTASNGYTELFNAEFCKVEWGILYLYDEEDDMFGSLVISFNKDQWKRVQPIKDAGR